MQSSSATARPIDHVCLTRIDPDEVLHEVRQAVA